MAALPTPAPVLPFIGVYANVPIELRAMRIWLPFKLKRRPNGKMGKPPVDARGRLCRGYTSPENQMTFEQALEVMRRRRLPGIGIVVNEHSGLFVYDADDCLVDDEPDQRTMTHLMALNTYTETSYSGHGIHCVGRGRLPGARSKEEPYELYDRRRFFVMTGRVFPGMPGHLAKCQSGLDAVYQDVFGDGAEALVNYQSGENSLTNCLTDCLTQPISCNTPANQQDNRVKQISLYTREKKGEGEK